MGDEPNKIAYGFKSRIYLSHPTSSFVFDKVQISFWNDVVHLSKEIQYTFFYYKLLGHDIVISPKSPILIEISSAHDNVGIELACGPILANKNIRKEFENYDLLINRYQESLD